MIPLKQELTPKQIYDRKYRQTHKEQRKEYDRKYRQTYNGIPEKRYFLYRKGAKERGIKFKITIDYFKKFWQKPCCYCGNEIKTIGLDRIDNTRGYIINNLIPCCSKCNRMKGKLSQKEFIEHCKKIAKNHKEE